MADVNTIVNSLVSSLSTVDAEGNVTDFDYEALKSICKELTSIKSSMKAQADEKAKEIKKQANAEQAEKGKAYAATLEPGSRVKYMKADGTVIEATVGEQKAGAKTLHVVLDEGTYDKSADRYVKFEKIVIA